MRISVLRILVVRISVRFPPTSFPTLFFESGWKYISVVKLSATRLEGGTVRKLLFFFDIWKHYVVIIFVG